MNTDANKEHKNKKVARRLRITRAKTIKTIFSLRKKTVSFNDDTPLTTETTFTDIS